MDVYVCVMYHTMCARCARGTRPVPRLACVCMPVLVLPMPFCECARGYLLFACVMSATSASMPTAAMLSPVPLCAELRTWRRSGAIYGMDVSSGAAVCALGVRPGDHCLDLCCAPGAKLCMLAELAGASGSATGVDVSLPRLATCRGSMLEKYKVPNVRLFLADSQHFAVPPPRTGQRADEVAAMTAYRKRRRKGQSAAAAALGVAGDMGDAEPRLFYVSPQFEAGRPGQALYDKVRPRGCHQVHRACTLPACTHPACTHPACVHRACTHPTCTHPACTHRACIHRACTHHACTWCSSACSPHAGPGGCRVYARRVPQGACIACVQSRWHVPVWVQGIVPISP